VDGGSVGGIGAVSVFLPVVVIVVIAPETAGRGSLQVLSKTKEKTVRIASGRGKNPLL